MKRTIPPAVALLALVGLVAALTLPLTSTRHPSTPLNAPRILAAGRSFTEACRAEGRIVPETVDLRELVARGWLTESDLGPLAGMDARFRLAADPSRPQESLLEVRLPDGGILVTLADGSVQQRPH